MPQIKLFKLTHKQCELNAAVNENEKGIISLTLFCLLNTNVPAMTGRGHLLHLEAVLVIMLT